jgi:hypothetical protein
MQLTPQWLAKPVPYWQRASIQVRSLRPTPFRKLSLKMLYNNSLQALKALVTPTVSLSHAGK